MKLLPNALLPLLFLLAIASRRRDQSYTRIASEEAKVPIKADRKWQQRLYKDGNINFKELELCISI